MQSRGSELFEVDRSKLDKKLVIARANKTIQAKIY